MNTHEKEMRANGESQSRQRGGGLKPSLRTALFTPCYYPELEPVFANPKGIASQSPGLPSPRGYPGSQATTFSTLKGLRLLAASDVASFLHARPKAQPRWGCDAQRTSTQGSRLAPILGFETESLWDSEVLQPKVVG